MSHRSKIIPKRISTVSIRFLCLVTCDMQRTGVEFTVNLAFPCSTKTGKFRRDPHWECTSCFVLLLLWQGHTESVLNDWGRSIFLTGSYAVYANISIYIYKSQFRAKGSNKSQLWEYNTPWFSIQWKKNTKQTWNLLMGSRWAPTSYKMDFRLTPITGLGQLRTGVISLITLLLTGDGAHLIPTWSLT